MTLDIITVGTLKEDYLRAGIEEYKKRISAYARVQIHELKEERVANEDDAASIDRALEAEAEKILARLAPDAYKVALCVEGTQYDSVALASVLERGSAKSGKLALVIGSSHGLSENVKRACDLRLSISKLTFPHQLMRLSLMEILYRSFSIMAGKKYHK
jgi:23S rRNA (pseudouridine1915-N3)-methyltransferase